MSAPKIFILSLPRSGSSLLAQLVASGSYQTTLSGAGGSFASHEFNKKGYFEDVPFTLLNDQLIKLYYGLEFSFLFPPSFEEFVSVMKIRKDKYPEGYEYDVDETTVFIPEGFAERVQEFTGTTWDVWGITRMINGGKWEKCYSKNGVNTKEGIVKQMQRFKENIEKAPFRLALKDPRLGLIMPLYDFQDVKVVWIKRGRKDVLRSMRKHYGPRMFTQQFIPGTQYVSNHFNHKVGYMAFDVYYDRYERAIGYCANRYQHLNIQFDDLVQGSVFEQLEEFIGSNVDRTIIDKSLVGGVH